MMKTTLITSLIACHLLYGVACADGERHQTDHHVPSEENHPGIVLFNLNKPLDETRTTDSRPAYYGVRDEPDRYPNNVMFEAIANLPVNNRLWTIYPDAFPEAENPLRSWRDFNVLDWNGTDPLPRMRPDSCIRRIQSLQRSGILPRDLNGYSFLLDWENGATEVREMGLTYWSDDSAPRFRIAWIAYRNQVVETLKALKARFPSSFFAVYAGGSIARVVGQNDAGTAPSMMNDRGQRTQRYYLHDTKKPILETIRRNYPDAMGPLLETPDFHTVVCYDAYGPLDWDDRSGFPPKKNETYLVENFRLLKEHSTRPVYGIVGAFTSGHRNLEQGEESNQDYQMFWKDRASWLKRTCRWLSRSDADGALVWNGLDALIFRYLILNVENYDEINADIRRYLAGPDRRMESVDQPRPAVGDVVQGTRRTARTAGHPKLPDPTALLRQHLTGPATERRDARRLSQDPLSNMERPAAAGPDLDAAHGNHPSARRREPDHQVRSGRRGRGIDPVRVRSNIGGSRFHHLPVDAKRSIGEPSETAVHRLTPDDVGRTISCEITYRAKDGSEPIVRTAHSRNIITTPTLATIEVDEDGSMARGLPEKTMASALGVAGLQPFTITRESPIILRTHDGAFPADAGRTRSWTIENGRDSVTITVDSKSIVRRGQVDHRRRTISRHPPFGAQKRHHEDLAQVLRLANHVEATGPDRTVIIVLS